MITLPSGWIAASLGDVATFERGIAFPSTDKRHEAGDGLVACLRTTNVQVEVDWDDLWFIPTKHVKNDAKWIRVDDILISTANSQNLVGKVARVRMVPTLSTLGAFIGLLRARCEVSPALLHYKLGSARFQELLRSTASQTTNIANISSTQMLSLSVELPPVNEQRRIVARLDAIFEQTRAAKARLERLPALLEKLKRSILAAAFRGDLTKDWRAANPTADAVSLGPERIRVGRRVVQAARDSATINEQLSLPGGWRWAKADDVVRDPIAYGVVQPGPEVVGGVPFVRAMDMEDDAILRSQVKGIAPEVAAAFSRTRLQTGDVLLGIVRAAKVAVVPADLAGGNIVRGIARLAPASGIHPPYLAAWLASPVAQRELLSKHRGIDMPVINLADVRELPIPLAPLEEQLAIATIVNRTREIIRGLVEQVRIAATALYTLEQAALAKAFRGELVPQDPADEHASILLERIRAARAARPTTPRRSRGDRQVQPTPTSAGPSNGHVTAPREDPLDLVIATFQQGEPRLGATAITQATGLDAAAVKRALATLVDSGQVRVHGHARGTTYEWAT
jgi:type I restriction enzyme S subunit